MHVWDPECVENVAAPLCSLVHFGGEIRIHVAVGCYPGKRVENVGAIWCSLMTLGRQKWRGRSMLLLLLTYSRCVRDTSPLVAAMLIQSVSTES